MSENSHVFMEQREFMLMLFMAHFFSSGSHKVGSIKRISPDMTCWMRKPQMRPPVKGTLNLNHLYTVSATLWLTVTITTQ